MRSISILFAALLALALGSVHAAHGAENSAESRAAARQSPDWLRDAVVYEIYPRAFSRAGDFKGVIAQLDRLKALGVTVLWLMPIHPVGQKEKKGTLGSPYAVRDYDAVSPEFGTANEFRQFVAAAHQRGLKVFIDIVANHTAWDSVLLAKHPEWYTHDAAGKIIPPNPDWVDVADLDWSQAGLRDYMTGMLVRWLRDYGLDGFRCDYASGVPTDFWEQLRPRLDQARPGLAMLAEADDPALLRGAFDIDYAWGFYHSVGEALAGRAPASAVRETWERDEAKYPRGALRLRFSDNHDQLRATAQAGLPAALAASALMFTLDGVPLLYNGMEVGDTVESAAPALFERAPIQWEMSERRPSVVPYYQALTALRRAHPALTRGTVRWLRNSDEQRVLSFERSTAGETLVVLINLSSQRFAGSVDTGPAAFEDLTPEAARAGKPRAGSPPTVFLDAWEFRVFRRAGP